MNNSDRTVTTHYRSQTFGVWAPHKEKMILHIVYPDDQKIEMIKDHSGYFKITIDHLPEGIRYFYMPDGKQDFPDPVSHFQPEGVHQASEVVYHDTFCWQDSNWKGKPFRDWIIYELHVGTFTPEGTFEAIIPRLDELIETGINAIELMPVAQFPGKRNWGYDAVYPYAVQNSYGGPNGLKMLINACHRKGIAVLLDVIYNHLGPEGNYLKEFGPYFTDKYRTPWGNALNFDGEWSDGVRDYFSDNALFWAENYHVDGLRLDAIHAVFDSGAVHFWELLNDKIMQWAERSGRPCYLIAESDFNSPRVTKSTECGGYGFTAQWLDDFHHALYVLLDAKGKSRYVDFGSLEQLAKAYTHGFVHSGEHVSFRKRKHGASSAGISGDRFVAFNMNHDQVGNRVRGERLGQLVDFDKLKIASAALFVSPYVPLLFMGEEYDDPTPFLYFIDHSDKKLIEAVQEGRKKEFAEINPEGEPLDPQAIETFNASILQWDKQRSGHHQLVRKWYQQLIALRKTHGAFKNAKKDSTVVTVLGEAMLVLHRQCEKNNHHLFCLINFSEQEVEYSFPSLTEELRIYMDSKDKKWVLENGYHQSMPATITSAATLRLLPVSITIYIN